MVPGGIRRGERGIKCKRGPLQMCLETLCQYVPNCFLILPYPVVIMEHLLHSIDNLSLEEGHLQVLKEEGSSEQDFFHTSVVYRLTF